jgi:hypothetical protein
MNIGYSSRLGYDKCAYDDKLKESTDPLSYRLYPGYIQSCNECLSTLGPRSGHNGVESSTPVGYPFATAQQLTDVESVLSNRNMKKSKCRKYGSNNIDVNKLELKHARICGDYLNPESSRLSYPVYNYREIATNRFYDLHRDPQANIFWDFAENTRLEAKDEYNPEVPYINEVDEVLPKNLKGTARGCKDNLCTSYCPKSTLKK